MQTLLSKTVVLDATNTFVYVGTFEAVDGDYLVLRDADVHDLRDTPTLTREQYVQRCRAHGLEVNRLRVWVKKGDVTSLSLLEDVAAC